MIIEFTYRYNRLSNVKYYNDNYKYFKAEYFISCNEMVYKYKEIYFKNELIHRKNKPAVKTLNQNGVTFHQAYYNKGKLHNSVGPAVIYSGDFFEVSFYLNNCLIEKNRFLNLLESNLNDN